MSDLRVLQPATRIVFLVKCLSLHHNVMSKDSSEFLIRVYDLLIERGVESKEDSVALYIGHGVLYATSPLPVSPKYA